jgi:hypothetical protein
VDHAHSVDADSSDEHHDTGNDPPCGFYSHRAFTLFLPFR